MSIGCAVTSSLLYFFGENPRLRSHLSQNQSQSPWISVLHLFVHIICKAVPLWPLKILLRPTINLTAVYLEYFGPFDFVFFLAIIFKPFFWPICKKIKLEKWWAQSCPSVPLGPTVTYQKNEKNRENISAWVAGHALCPATALLTDWVVLCWGASCIRLYEW